MPLRFLQWGQRRAPGKDESVNGTGGRLARVSYFVRAKATSATGVTCEALELLCDISKLLRGLESAAQVDEEVEAHHSKLWPIGARRVSFEPIHRRLIFGKGRKYQITFHELDLRGLKSTVGIATSD